MKNEKETHTYIQIQQRFTFRIKKPTFIVSWKTQKKKTHTNIEHKTYQRKPQIDEKPHGKQYNPTNKSESMRSYLTLTGECRDPQRRQRCP